MSCETVFFGWWWWAVSIVSWELGKYLGKKMRVHELPWATFPARWILRKLEERDSPQSLGTEVTSNLQRFLLVAAGAAVGVLVVLFAFNHNGLR